MKMSSMVHACTAVLLTLLAWPGMGLAADTSLKACWRFDEGKGEVAGDSSNNGNDGRVTGPTWAKGISGSALRFDGDDDYVDIGSGRGIGLGGGDFSISVWVNVSDISSNRPIIANKNIPDNTAGYALFANKHGFYVLKLGSGTKSKYVASRASSVRLGVWQHLVVTRAGSTLKLYLDGAQQATTTGASYSLTAGDNYIGKDSAGSYFSGTLDEVHVYDRPLTPAEIKGEFEQLASEAAAPSGKKPGLALGKPGNRPDRLVTITGWRNEELITECSTDAGKTWRSATIYRGVTIDEWRTCRHASWNQGAIKGRIPVGLARCLWNYFFDVAMPTDTAMFRLRKPGDGSVVLEKSVDLSGAKDVFVIDRRNIAELAGGELPPPWKLKPGDKKKPVVASVYCSADDPATPPLVLKPNLKGWHRIYVGMEPYPVFQFYLSKEEIAYSIPAYVGDPNKGGRAHYMQEFYLKSADLTGQDVCLALGGARHWRDASVRHIRFVPMTSEEIAHFHDVRKLAEAKGRAFVGYVEPVSPACNQPDTLTLRDHLRNEMRLNKDRGSTEVYVHVIRVGMKAWYHSDVVKRHDATREEHNSWGKYTLWMKQGDPLAVALEEGRTVGLKVFADMGMTQTGIGAGPEYEVLTEPFGKEHPECIAPGARQYLDYRKALVRDYVVSIARELLTKYDLDGINLDFARWGYNKAYDEASLVDVVQRIHKARQEAQIKWGHPVKIATRIPSYLYGGDKDWEKKLYGGDHPWFVAALKTWAQNGWIDRVMPCVDWSKVDKLSMQRYVAAVAGTKVEVWGDLYGPLHTGRPRSYYLDAARRWAKEGMDGGFFIYERNRPTEYERINWMLRLIDFPKVKVEPYGPE